jgi:hypothetical protein
MVFRDLGAVTSTFASWALLTIKRTGWKSALTWS